MEHMGWPVLLVIALGFVLSHVHAADAASGRWKSIDGVRVPVPPSEHPRVFLMKKHLPDLRRRVADPALRDCRRRMERDAKRDADRRIEWRAMECLLSGDQAKAKNVVADALALLKKTKLRKDANDACRLTGRMMVTGAIAYDWLYPVLADEQKKAFEREFVRLAKTLECSYPPTRQGSVTGHSSEAMIMRDMMSAGIAMYDETSEMYDHAAKRFFGEHLPARNWFYPGNAYHQGDSYGPSRFSWDLFPVWIFDRMGFPNIYDPGQQYIPYYWLYTMRPDGQRLRGGDTYMISRRRGQTWGWIGTTILTGSYYKDGILLGEWAKEDGLRGRDRIFEFLWRDTSVRPVPHQTLPLTRYFGSPFGWMVARTSWDDNACIVEMKVNEYNFCNHQHLDAGAFQIYYKGALALDSGLYQGAAGGYGSDHCKNYSWRTIAHNCLLVHDPKEKFRPDRGYHNDGGERFPNDRREPRTLSVLLDPKNGYQTGEVKAHAFGPDEKKPAFTYLKGDITRAYSDKVRLVERSFAFFNTGDARSPGVFVVLDRVVSSNPSFKKTWLLHTMEEPQRRDAAVVVDRTEHGSAGRLVLTPVLPEDDDREVTFVGGKGKEFLVGGKNYAARVRPGQEGRSEELGAWRVEISPKRQATATTYLNVMQLCDRAASRTMPVESVTTRTCVGCRAGDYVALFSKSGRPHRSSVTLELTGTRRSRVLVADLSPGTWRVKRGWSTVKTVTVAKDGGAAYFEGTSGKYTLSR